MSLTQDDLKSIADVVQPMIDKLDESLSISTAKGFEGVDKNFKRADLRFTQLDEKIDKLGKDLGHKINNLGVTQDKILDTLLPYDVRFKRLRDAIKPK